MPHGAARAARRDVHTGPPYHRAELLEENVAIVRKDNGEARSKWYEYCRHTGSGAFRAHTREIEMAEVIEGHVVCAGKRRGTLEGGKTITYHEWRIIDGNGAIGQPMVFEKLKGWVGAVHEAVITMTDDGGTRIRLGKWIRQHENVELKAEWEALEGAAQVEARIAADKRKGKEEDNFAELLAPLRRAYMAADPIGRQVIVARAIRAITKPY